MTLSTTSLLLSPSGPKLIAQAPLNSSSSTALAPLGAIYEDHHPYYGARKFQYVRFDTAGTANDVHSYVANVAVNNITSGTTTTITTSGLTANIHVNGILYCLDDNGAAGAAPEGEMGRIIANTATVITIHPDDAFSAAPAANDDFVIIKRWAVGDSADGDYACNVAGVSMADQDQYDYGWVQFYGIHPYVACVAAGTTIPANEGVVANAGTVNDGAGDAQALWIGHSLHQLTTDTVIRTMAVDLCCGPAARQVATSTS